MRLVVFTAALGETYPVQAPSVIEPDVRYVCFSDRPCPAPYEWVRTEPTATPMYASRRIKILADHEALDGADATLWHDSSYRLLRDTRWVRRELDGVDAAAMSHPNRCQIEREAERIAQYGYVTSDQAAALVRRYRLAGFVEPDGLTASGLLARRCSPLMTRFNAIWWREAQRWGGRDQGSVDFAAWKAGITIRHIVGTVKDNRYAAFRLPIPVAVPA